MLLVTFDTEAGNYYRKSTFIVTLIKQEKLVFMLDTFGVFMCFCKNFTGTQILF